MASLRNLISVPHKKLVANGSSDFCKTRHPSFQKWYLGLQAFFTRLPLTLPGLPKSCISCVSSVSSGVVNSSTPNFEDIAVSTMRDNESKELKISVVVSGAKTQLLFDEVFNKIVADSQPIPGFRRVKGGTTPNIPKYILLEVLGHSRIYREAISKIINYSIAGYVKKEGLKVGNDLRVEQSIEESEAVFEPGEEFKFDAVLGLVD